LTLTVLSAVIITNAVNVKITDSISMVVYVKHVQLLSKAVKIVIVLKFVLNVNQDSIIHKMISVSAVKYYRTVDYAQPIIHAINVLIITSLKKDSVNYANTSSLNVNSAIQSRNAVVVQLATI
jgi:hypothetical protein